MRETFVVKIFIDDYTLSRWNERSDEWMDFGYALINQGCVVDPPTGIIDISEEMLVTRAMMEDSALQAELYYISDIEMIYEMRCIPFDLITHPEHWKMTEDSIYPKKEKINDGIILEVEYFACAEDNEVF